MDYLLGGRSEHAINMQPIVLSFLCNGFSKAKLRFLNSVDSGGELRRQLVLVIMCNSRPELAVVWFRMTEVKHHWKMGRCSRD